MPRMKERPEARASGRTRFRDELAGSIFQTMLAIDKPSTYSENGWLDQVRVIARRSTRAADILIEELSHEQ